MSKLFLPSPLQYKKNQLYFSQKLVSELAQKHGTPLYLYSKNILESMYTHFEKEAKKAKIPSPLICYAVKANANHDVLKALASLGSGADVVSAGELKVALDAGMTADKIVFSGVAKTEKEILYALDCSKNGIYSFNVESIEELELINQCAQSLGKMARVAFRLNPQVNAKTHKHISTGNKTHKFGILKDDILKSLSIGKYWTHTKLVGLSIHIGSQLTELNATVKAIKEMAELALIIPNDLEFLDVGGGLGIDYTEKERKKLASIHQYMQTVSKALSQYYYSKTSSRPRVVFEPGRILVGKMGVLVSEVIRTKTSQKHHFTIIDAGMNDLIRPALYEAHHEIFPCLIRKQKIKTDVVGPICETSDCFATQITISELESGDYLAIENAGAYGRSMASNYNQRDFAKEIFI